MTKKMLLVIDMLNDFIHPQGQLSCGEDVEEIVDFVVSKVQEFLGHKHPVVFVKDSHLSDDLEFKRFPTHCVAQTWGAELIEQLKPFEFDARAYRIEKQRYSAFYNTDLDRIIEKEKPEAFYVVGVCTNICVLYTVEELCNRDLTVRVYRDGVMSFDTAAHEFALQQMENVLGAEILAD